MAKHSDDGIVTFLLGLISGLVAGAAFGLLFAPKSGEETRDDLQSLAKNLPSDIKDPNGRTREFIDRTRINIENQISDVKSRREADKTAKAKRAEEIAGGGYELN